MQEDSIARLQKNKCAGKVDNGLSSLLGDTIIEQVHGGGTQKKKQRKAMLVVSAAATHPTGCDI